MFVYSAFFNTKCRNVGDFKFNSKFTQEETLSIVLDCFSVSFACEEVEVKNKVVIF